MRELLVLAIAAFFALCAAHNPVETEKSVSLNTQILVFEDNGVWKALITATLPNPCHKLEFLGVKRRGDTFTVSFRHTPPEPDMVCIQVLQKYNKTVELGRLEKGEYKVAVEINGAVVRELPFKVKD